MKLKYNISCPDCGGEVQYFHESVVYRNGITKIVCKNRCNGFKVLQEIDRTAHNHPVHADKKHNVLKFTKVESVSCW